jgi:hypothetical protein
MPIETLRPASRSGQQPIYDQSHSSYSRSWIIHEMAARVCQAFGSSPLPVVTACQVMPRLARCGLVGRV